MTTARKVLIVMMIALAVVFGLLIYRFSQVLTQSNSPQANATTTSSSVTPQEKSIAIQALVGKAMQADASWGVPTVSVIEDIEKVKQSNPEFFNKGEKGDWLLIYPTKKKAVLYRESTSTIIAFAETE